MKQVFLAIAIALMPLAAVAQDFDRGLAAFEAGDYATALREFRPLADLGDAAGQGALGIIYGLGKGVPQDYAEAMRWFRLSAEQGNAEAQYRIGLMYGTGKGVPQSWMMAHVWLNIASANGSEKGTENREIAARHLTPGQLAEAQRRARVCMESNYTDCD